MPTGLAAQSTDMGGAPAVAEPDKTSGRLSDVVENPGADGDDSARTWQGIPGIERAPNGRLWAIWYSGAKSEGLPGNYCLVATSGDDGKTWSKPVLMIKGLTPQSSTFDPLPWVDPKGRLWLFYAQYTRDLDDKISSYGTFAVRADSPGEADPVWSDPFLVANGGRIFGKPIVGTHEEWLAPLFLNTSADSAEKETCVLMSTNKGEKWQYLGGTHVPHEQRNFSEHTLARKNNGDLWTVIRTMQGLSESTSSDGGRTWSDPVLFRDGPNTRAYVRRLESGAFLLVYHDVGKDDLPQTASKEKPKYPRNKLTVWLSDDEGRTWPYKLLLDARKGCSYPDVTQAPDGRIYIAYDCMRYGNFQGEVSEIGPGKEIAMAVVREEDIRAGKIISPESRLRQVISRASGYGNTIELKKVAESEMRQKINNE